MQPSKRIFINTIAQYTRSIFSMILALFATRIILKSLGVEDYGIYSVIAGVVSLLSFITNALAISTQRFLSVAQGYGNINDAKMIFNTSVVLHLSVGAFIVVCLEILYPFLMNGFLNIPVDRLGAAQVLYHLVAGVLFFTLISSPYRALVIAHENIVYISIIEVLDALFKLLIALSLNFVTYDKLIIYGFLLLCIQFFNLIALSVYSAKKYTECTLPSFSNVDKKFFRGIFSFAGWTMYNIGCNYGRTQGIAVALNKILGTAVNAAYGLAFQVSGALSSLSQSLSNAINPQLMKAEGGGDRARMIRLAEKQSKFSFLMMAAISIPTLFEMNTLLSLWLGEVPEFSVLFCRMIIIAALCDLLTVGLGSANQAIGNIKNYTLVIYTVKLLTLPFAVLLLHFGYDLLYVAIIYVSFEFISSIIRLPFLHYSANLNVLLFVKNVFFKEVIPLITIILSCWLIVTKIDTNYRFIITFTLSNILFLISVFLFGLSNDEKVIIEKISDKFLFKCKK